jgi:hypothetical protein
VLSAPPDRVRLNRVSALPDHDPSSPLTGDSSLGAVIAEFVKATHPGRDRRSALSHADAELGTMPVRSVRTRHVAALLDDLRAAGLSARRETAIADALHALFAFALVRGLIAADPVPESARAARHDPPGRVPAVSPLAEEPRTPTLTMLALGARVAWWTAWIVTLVFVVLLLALVAELA